MKSRFLIREAAFHCIIIELAWLIPDTSEQDGFKSLGFQWISKNRNHVNQGTFPHPV